MARARRGAALRHVQALFDEGTFGGLTDGQLLEQFTTRGGEAAEWAFAALVERHGPMVFRTCRAILRDPHDVHDAFQATFLVLVRRARSLWVRDSLGAWLHQVARRTASCARSAAARRRRHEREAAGRARLSVYIEGPDDLGDVLREELDRLPEPFRAAVVTCLVEGLTHEQAARRLGWPVGTVESRLARGRERLRARLAGRDLAPAVGAIAAALAADRARAAVPAALAETTVRAALRFSAGRAAGAEAVSAGALALAESVWRTMSMTLMKMAGAFALAVGLAPAGAGVWASQRDRARQGEAPAPTARPPAEKAAAIVARVDDTPITSDELIERCLARYGAKELDTLINTLIVHRECERRGITVTDAEVEAEAALFAARYGKNRDDWYRILEKERGWSKDAYLRDIVQPHLMAEKLKVIGAFMSMEDLKSKARVDVYFGEPRNSGRSDERARPLSRSQEDRLRDVERKLEDTLKALESLRREVGR